MPPKKSRK